MSVGTERATAQGDSFDERCRGTDDGAHGCAPSVSTWSQVGVSWTFENTRFGRVVKLWSSGRWWSWRSTEGKC